MTKIHGFVKKHKAFRQLPPCASLALSLWNWYHIAGHIFNGQVTDMSCKGILFDLDGTLWDSAPVVTDSWMDYIQKNTDLPHRCTVSDMRGYMGKTFEQIAAEFLPDLPKAERDGLLKTLFAYEREYMPPREIPLFPDEESVIRQLAKEYKLAIVSNCDYGYIDVYLDKCGFPELFADYQYFDGLTRSKGENIIRVMKRNDIDSCIYIGDTQGDADSAKEAGVPFIHAAFGYGTVRFCDASAGLFSELPGLVRKFF